MSKIRKSSIALAAVVGAGGLFLSDHFSTTAPRTYLSQAEAVIGRPLTPLSVAGVARRTTRRAVAAGAIGYGAYAVGRYGYSDYYGTPSYANYGYSSYYGTPGYSNYGYSGYYGAPGYTNYGYSGYYGTPADTNYGYSGYYGTPGYTNYGYSGYYGTPGYTNYGYSGYYATPGYSGYASFGGRDDAYCASRYRSYDPASGTYLGYDGVRHSCP